MNRLYDCLAISKQSFHQKMQRLSDRRFHEHQLLFLVYELRDSHPTMGARDMYYKLLPEFMGRDAFESFCRREGLCSERQVNGRRTTDSRGVIRFKNLTTGLIVNSLNQLWVSDITYYEVCGKFYYLTFIMDAFSRRILGYSVSRRLYTEQTSLAAFEMAVSLRKRKALSGLIFHSDGGGQYYDKEFIIQCRKYGIINSMCEYPWENAYAERINGVIKNNYLRHRSIRSFVDLEKEVDRSVKLYNEEKPHSALKRVSPVMFENNYLSLGKTSGGEKSTTEYEKLQPEGLLQPSGLWGKHPKVQISLQNMKNNNVKQ